MSMWIEEELVGKRIVGARIKSPTVWLEVQCGGWIEITAEGDCCSEAFIDAVVVEREPTLSGKQESMAFPAEPTTQEVDELIAVRFVGDNGHVSILHRNSSNGYYGNYLNVNSRGVPPEDAVNSKVWYRQVHKTQQETP